MQHALVFSGFDLCFSGGMTAATAGGEHDMTCTFNCSRKRARLSDIPAHNFDDTREQRACVCRIPGEDSHWHLPSFEQTNDQRTCASRTSDYQNHASTYSMTPGEECRFCAWFLLSGPNLKDKRTDCGAV